MQLCTLAQLKAAYDSGFRDNNWSLFDMEGRDARVSPCWEYYWRRGECYFIVEGNSGISLIPNTPRPANFEPVYCCPRGSSPLHGT